MLSYPIRFIPQADKLVLLVFPDIPEAVVVGASEEDAIARAPALLETVLSGYVLEGRPIPKPSDICGAPAVEAPRFSLVGVDAAD